MQEKEIILLVTFISRMMSNTSIYGAQRSCGTTTSSSEPWDISGIASISGISGEVGLKESIETQPKSVSMMSVNHDV